MESLLLHIRNTRQFDFTGYKRSTLGRRIAKRMQEVGCETYGDYEDYLEVHPEEFVVFFNTILINVTAFFRDPQAWDFVAAEVIPRIVSGKQPGAPIRIWSAGCASGEEAYTLAMILAESLGRQPFRERVKIYGTDVDDDALSKARQATYAAKDVSDIPEELLERYFERVGDGYGFSKDLRRSVIFGRHDLLQDAPIGRLDLLVCRNTLMYFNAEAQEGIIDRFRFALDGHGYLFLGKAETMLKGSSAWRPIDLKLRIFESVPDGTRSRAALARDAEHGSDRTTRTTTSLRDAALMASNVPLVVVDVNGTVAMVSSAARSTFGIAPSQVGLPVQDLELSYRPIELRALIDEAYQERRTVEYRNVEYAAGSEATRVFDVRVTPLFDAGDTTLGAEIVFDDVTRYRRLQDELEHSARELETAYEELQSTNEELETTNEELQSTIEELETTNEELQSTNEELETTNEELQSTNDELNAVNEALQARGIELDLANDYLQSILAGLGRGVAVVDNELVVRLWNEWAEDLWGLRKEEVEGRHFANLDIGLPVHEVLPTVRHFLDAPDGRGSFSVKARNRRGFDIECQLKLSPLGTAAEPSGVIIVMEVPLDAE
jgi:two-component system CheB/CheR fusion protein